MTVLLDAARRLADWVPTTSTGISPRVIDGVSGWSRYECIVCLAETLKGHHTEIQHTDDCPWRALPQIMAVIEAAEAAVDEFGHTKRCPFCGPRLQLRPRARHDEVCPWTALAAALRGGEGE